VLQYTWPPEKGTAITPTDWCGRNLSLYVDMFVVVGRKEIDVLHFLVRQGKGGLDCMQQVRYEQLP
jgi:hypothetical protein